MRGKKIRHGDTVECLGQKFQAVQTGNTQE